MHKNFNYSMLDNKSIRLFVLRDLVLSNELARIQLAMQPKSIDLFSVTNVCLGSIDPDQFKQIITGPFKARKYTFSTIKNAHSGSFCDNLLLGNSFLHAQSVSLCYVSF